MNRGIKQQIAAPVTLQSFCGGAGDLTALSKLIDTDISGGDLALNLPSNVYIEDWHDGCESMPFFSSVDCAAEYDRTNQAFHFYPRNDVPMNNFRAGWLAANYLQFAVLSAMYRGRKFLMVHGAVLKIKDGVLLILGEGGVGKSTSCRRWQSAGYSAISDDMFLLEYAADELMIHPMPTWSLCAQSMEGLSYPICDVYPVKGVLCIARSDDAESILPVSRAEFFTQIYSSCLFFNRRFVNMFKDERREIVLQAVRDAADKLSDNFAPRALFANLNGDIGKTLEEFL